jgi:hypothetical protein
MSIKIKINRTKIRRRGSRLIVTSDNQRIEYIGNPNGGNPRVIKAERPDSKLSVTYSSCGRFLLAQGTHDDEPVQYALVDDFFTMPVAIRPTDEDGWAFPGIENRDELWVSVNDVGITNVAVRASLVEREIDRDLAEFLDMSPLLCLLDKALAITEDPKWKKLRDFAFRVDDLAGPVGTGRRAENKWRHEATNYSEMLEAGGGLLWPEQYQTVRRGVDRLVRAHMVVANDGGAR